MKSTHPKIHVSLAALTLAIASLLPAAPAARAVDEGEPYALPLSVAIDALPIAPEDRTGYQRTSFKHWVDADGDGCSTRQEVLIEEGGLQEPPAATGCHFSGGEWLSWYDGQEITDPRKIDIDHLVPLAESWDSGASTWTPLERQYYANDLDDPRALVAVSASQNRAKADKDPADWLPADPAVHCRYVSDWTAIKLRYRLSADEREVEALKAVAAGCEDDQVTVIPAPGRIPPEPLPS